MASNQENSDLNNLLQRQQAELQDVKMRYAEAMLAKSRQEEMIVKLQQQLKQSNEELEAARKAKK